MCATGSVSVIPVGVNSTLGRTQMAKPKSLQIGDFTALLYAGDALSSLKKMASNSADIVITSPPYCIGKPYEDSVSADDFRKMHEKILPQVERIVKPGGSICWQVGSHLTNGVLVPLDAVVYSAAISKTNLRLRNRIIWTFGHGFHGKKRFSGRHESILWFTKGDDYYFDVDPVRVPQKYPGKRAYKGPKKGEWSGNPLGKNPGDVWDIPNVKAKHPEKVGHPCQYPVALAQRLIRSLSPKGGTVLDPFMGSGTSGVAALLDHRNFVGIDIHAKYVELAAERMRAMQDGTIQVRPDVPPRSPKRGEAVSIRPPHFSIPGIT